MGGSVDARHFRQSLVDCVRDGLRPDRGWWRGQCLRIRGFSEADQWLGRSDRAIILWRRILERELRAMSEGRPMKEWTPAPAEIVPTLGF